MIISDLRAAARFAVGLRGFVQTPRTPDECERRLRDGLASRNQHFLSVLERGAYGQPRSPYRALLKHAGIELGDVARLVEENGIEATLHKLRDAGVYAAFEEFKGRRPIQRGSLSLEVTARSFDNPLLAPAYDRPSEGSRSVGRRIVFDFGELEMGVLGDYLFGITFGVLGRPQALWQPVPPSTPGLKRTLRSLKLGQPMERWFSQTEFRFSSAPKEYLITRYALAGSRRWAKPLPRPEHVPPDQAVTVARWLAEKTAAGTPAHLVASSSAGVLVCRAALDHGLDIAGTMFALGGEPYTQAKADVIAATGSRAAASYGMTEMGRNSIACGAPEALDEVHPLGDRVAVIQREKDIGAARVGALLFTTLAPTSPKLLLNVESDDYGVLRERDCGCPIGERGFRVHLSEIRSYDKLTAAGMTFLGSDLIELVEEILPRRFGGSPTDYQFVEQEDSGVPKVDVVVSPRIGQLDEGALIAAVLEGLGDGPAYKRMMSEIWRDGRTLRVIRREPYATPTAKILPLHLLRN